MSVAFWSIKLSGGCAVEVQPPEGYVLNLQQAALSGEGVAVIQVQTVSVEGGKIDSVMPLFVPVLPIKQISTWFSAMTRDY